MASQLTNPGRSPAGSGPTELTLPLPPTVNRLWRGNRAGRRWLDPQAAKFKETAARIAFSKGVRPVAGRMEVEVTFYIDPLRPRDIDASIKVLLDALNGVCWADDKQIRKLSVELADDDGIGPRTVLRFGPIAEAGSFRREVEAVLKRS